MFRFLIGVGIVYAAYKIGKEVARVPVNIDPLLLPRDSDRAASQRQSREMGVEPR